jgi:hypothetical protein
VLAVLQSHWLLALCQTSYVWSCFRTFVPMVLSEMSFLQSHQPLPQLLLVMAQLSPLREAFLISMSQHAWKFLAIPSPSHPTQLPFPMFSQYLSPTYILWILFTFFGLSSWLSCELNYGRDQVTFVPGPKGPR